MEPDPEDSKGISDKPKRQSGEKAKKRKSSAGLSQFNQSQTGPEEPSPVPDPPKSFQAPNQGPVQPYPGPPPYQPQKPAYQPQQPNYRPPFQPQQPNYRANGPAAVGPTAPNQPPTAPPSSSPSSAGQGQKQCYRCLASVVPIQDSYPTMKTHIISAIFFLCGFPFCIFLPYMFDFCGTKISRCPRCGYIENRP